MCLNINQNFWFKNEFVIKSSSKIETIFWKIIFVIKIIWFVFECFEYLNNKLKKLLRVENMKVVSLKKSAKRKISSSKFAPKVNGRVYLLFTVTISVSDRILLNITAKTKKFFRSVAIAYHSLHFLCHIRPFIFKLCLSPNWPPNSTEILKWILLTEFDLRFFNFQMTEIVKQ